jgi:hypothetical protein
MFDFIPVLILFLIVCYPVEFAYLSETSLGKLFFVMLIIYYARMDPIYGVFVCGLILLYYQLGPIQHILAVERNRLILESMATGIQDQKEEDVEYTEYIEDEYGSYTKNDATIYAYENDMNYNEDMLTKKIVHEGGLVAEFRHQECPQAFDPEKVTVYDSHFAKCFPTSVERIEVEETEIWAKSSKEATPISWEKMFSDFRPIESMMDDFHQWSDYMQDAVSSFK